MNKVMIACLIVLLSGCQSIVFTSSPSSKVKFDVMTSKQPFCSTNYGWPIMDVIGGALFTYTLSQTNRADLEVVAVAAVSALSATYGLISVSDCRKAKEQYDSSLKKQLKEMREIQRKLNMRRVTGE